SATDQKLHCPPQSMMICSAVESALNYLATDRFAKINYGLRARIQTRHLHQLRAPEQSTHGRRRRLGIALSCSAGHRIEATCGQNADDLARPRARAQSTLRSNYQRGGRQFRALSDNQFPAAQSITLLPAGDPLVLRTGAERRLEPEHRRPQTHSERA